MERQFISHVWNITRLVLSLSVLCIGMLVSQPQLARAMNSTILQTCDAADLINAIVAANADAAADAIVLAPNCNGANAYLLTQENNSGNGLPIITGNLTIEGKGSTIARSTANGVPQFRLFQVNAQAILTLNDVTLQGGNAGEGNGGAIATNGAVNINTSNLIENTAAQGGAIFVSYPGTLSLATTTLSQNSATSFGGGIALFNGGVATIAGSTFVQNTLNNGSFGAGFAIFNSTATIVNSTFYNNDAGGGFGGGIGNAASTLTLINDTIAGNSAASLGGGGVSNQGNTTILNTIVSQNSGGNCQTINMMDQGNNIDSGASCGFTMSSSLNNTDSQLGALANNGGPTQTMALASTSPAIGAAARVGCNVQPVSGIDQRGESRQQTFHCDIGAYEFEKTTLACPQTPDTPKLISPARNAQLNRARVSLDWNFDACTRKYELKLFAADNPTQPLVESRHIPSHYTTAPLERNKKYLWQVRACSKQKCSAWSSARAFSIKP